MDTQVSANVGLAFEGGSVSLDLASCRDIVGKHTTSKIERFLSTSEQDDEKKLVKKYGMRSMFVCGEEDG